MLENKLNIFLGNRRQWSPVSVFLNLFILRNNLVQEPSKIKPELYEGIITKEIYNRAFNLLKAGNRTSISKYKLKTAIYELSPTGFAFEKFIAALLSHSGYQYTIYFRCCKICEMCQSQLGLSKRRRT